MPETRKGRRASEVKTKAAGLLAQGLSIADVAAAVEVSRTTLWRWCTSDQDFIALRKQLTDAAVAAHVQSVRALTTKAHRVLDEAMDATEGITLKIGDEVTFEQTPDHAVRTRAATQVLRVQPEFANKTEVELGVSERLAALIERLDDSGDAGSDAPATPAG